MRTEITSVHTDPLYRTDERSLHTVDLVLMTVQDDRLKILLVRHLEQGQQIWSLPGCVIAGTEDMEKAVQRRLKKEIRMADMTYFRQLYTLGNAARVPEKRVFSTAYLTLTPSENIISGSSGRWFDITKTAEEISNEGRRSLLTLESGGIRMQYRVYDIAMQNYIRTRSKELGSSGRLALDHIKVINIAMDQVQHRAASTGILFNLLPPECTLREIQNVYEAVTGRKTDTANFRRDIRKMLKDTGRKKKTGARSAALFTFNPMYTYLKENL